MQCANDLHRARYASDPAAGRERKNAARRMNVDHNRLLDREQRKKHKEKRDANWKAYYAENKDRLKIKKREYALANRDAYLLMQKTWRDMNVGRRTFLQNKREAKQRNATPDWSDELDDFVWNEAANLVRSRKEATGIDWHADHMIPLAGYDACGLHVALNCQVIPALLNMRKRTKMIFTEPFEWLQAVHLVPESDIHLHLDSEADHDVISKAGMK